MSWTNHPLLVSQAGAAADPQKPTPYACYSASVDDTVAATDAVVIDSSNFSGIADGDYLVVELICNHDVANTAYNWLPPDATWTMLVPGVGSTHAHNEQNYCCFGRFYKSADTTYTFTNQSSADLTFKYRVCWYRGVNRLVPYDYVRSNYGEPTGWHNTTARTIRWLDNRFHADAGDIGLFYLMGGMDEDTPGSVTLSSGRLISEGVTFIDSNALYAALGGAGGTPATEYQTMYTTRVWRDRVASNNIAAANVQGAIDCSSGMSLHNLTVTEFTSTDRAYDRLVTVNPSAIAQDYYIYYDVTLTAGDTIWWRGRMGNASITPYEWALVVEQPDGTLYGFAPLIDTRSMDQPSGDGLCSAPDYAFSTHDPGSPASSTYKSGGCMKLTTDQSGTHRLRAQVWGGSGTTTFTPTISNGQNTGLCPMGFAYSIVGVPALTNGASWGLATDYYDNGVPPVFFDFSIASQVGYDPALVPNISAAHQFQLVSSEATLNPMRLYNNTDDHYVIEDGGLQWDGTPKQPSGLYSFPDERYKEAIISDRVIPPSYFATTIATTPTTGKYYMEVTYTGTTTTHTHWVMGVAPASDHYHGFDNITTPHVFTGIGADTYTYSAGSRSFGGWAGSFTNGDVFGIAVDFSLGLAYFYENGTLAATCDMTQTTDNGSLYCPWRFVMKMGSPNSNISPTVTVNFTGPFTYSKPSGFVAFDWLNEVA